MAKLLLALLAILAITTTFSQSARGQAAAAAPPTARRGGGGPPARPGPPAPVPPEVAFPRPTAAELAQINDAIAHFIATDTSATKPLLDKFQNLLVVQPPRINPAICPFPRNAQRHAAFVETAKKGDIDLLFEGDSITDWWIMNGKNAYAKYFGNMKVANFAIAGDTTQGVLWGLQNGEGQGFQPKAIMLMVGTNNAGNCSAAEIAEGVGSIILEDRKDFPNAKILLLGIFPRSDPTDPVRVKLADVNKIISRLDDHQHVFYMDIGSKFLDENGVFLPNAFLRDKIHPQELGYDIWGAAVKDTLAGFMN